MATSTLRFYTSSDPFGPGLVTGISGSLISVLDAVLVNGYGTGQYLKPAAGWSKPLSNVSASAGFSASLACYKPNSGSQMTLFVNDGHANTTALGKEAWLCGFEQITGLTASNHPAGGLFTGSFGNGTGYGQFPLPAQQLTTGHVVARKSTTSDAVGRFWVIAADAYTCYMWILSADAASTYMFWAFGDFFSLRGPADTYRCMLLGRVLENNSSVAGLTVDWTNMISGGTTGQSGPGAVLQTVGSIQPGHWIARSVGGTVGSVGFSKRGVPEGSLGFASAPGGGSINGSLTCPNPTDNSLYIAPIQVIEAPGSVRGRLRGIFQVAHAAANFSDGQVITGGGDYSGKSFTIVKFLSDTSGFLAVESSATVETN